MMTFGRKRILKDINYNRFLYKQIMLKLKRIKILAAMKNISRHDQNDKFSRQIMVASKE